MVNEDLGGVNIREKKKHGEVLPSPGAEFRWLK
jgi:hypothetical protein